MTERGTTGAGEPQVIGVPRVQTTPQAGWTLHYWERHSPRSNQGWPQWNSPVDTASNDPRQYGDGRGEVIPSFDGTNFRQYERRGRLFVPHTRVAPEKRASKLLERLEARAFESREGTQDLETPNGVENLLDFLRTRCGPIEVFSGRLVDNIVHDFRASANGGKQEVRATERCRAHGDCSSLCFARGSSLASKTVRSVLCPRSGGPG